MDEIVLQACCVDQRFDRWFGDDRNTYLSFALDSLMRKEELLLKLWRSLTRSRRSLNQEQLLGIAATYASRGDKAASRVLERVCLRNQKAGYSKSLRWLIEGWRREGLSYVLDQALPDDGDTAAILYFAAERTLGKRRVNSILKKSQTPAALALWDALHKREPREAKPKQTALEQVQTAIAASVRPKYFAIRDLSPNDLQTLAGSPPKQGGDALFYWLGVFHGRPFPGDPVVLETYVKHGPFYVRQAAFYALAQLEGEVPRRVALKYWSHRQMGGPAIGILANNFAPGDEELIMNCLKQPRADWWFEYVAIALGEILDCIELSNEGEIRRFVYDHSACSQCRHYALHKMIELDIADRGTLEEAQFDEDGSTREMVAEALRVKANPTT